MRRAWLRGPRRLPLSAALLAAAALATGVAAGLLLAPPSDSARLALEAPPQRTVQIQAPTFAGSVPDLPPAPSAEASAEVGAEGEEFAESAGVSESAVESAPAPQPAPAPQASGGESEGGSFGAPVGGSSE